MVDFTVAICTYNGADRLSSVLDNLKTQTNTEHFSWEVVVIDNNSTDTTADLIRTYQSQWSSLCPLHYYFEPKQGLAFARRLAVKHAQGEVIGFLDDDNIPAANWVSAAYDFAQRYPQAGAFGSQIHGDYEVTPPASFKRIACYLAIVERGNKPLLYSSKSWMFPAGAGLVVRKRVWQAHVPEQPKLKGICAASLSSKGEDLETLAHIRNAGWEIWYNPDMHIHHRIPKWRLEQDYLLRLFRGVGLSRYPIRMLRFRGWQRPVMMLLYFVNDLRKLVLYWIQHRDRSPNNLVALCEQELLRHSVVSPFYHWKQWIWRE